MSSGLGFYPRGLGDYRPPEEIAFAVVVTDDSDTPYIASTTDDLGDETTPILKQG